MRYSREIYGRSPFDGSAALCLLLPMFMQLQVTVIGRLMLPEAVIVAIFPYILMLRAHLLKERQILRLIVLGFVWLAALITSDIVRHSAAVNYLRGWALVGFTLLDFVCFYLLVEKKMTRLKLLVLGWAIGSGIETLLDPGSDGVRWKMGGGDALLIGGMALFALCQSNFVRARNESVAAAVAGSALGVLFNARNLAGRMFLNAALLGLTYIRRERTATGLKPRRILAIAVFALPLTYIALEGYGLLADSGVMGQDAKLTYQMQSNAKFGVFGVLFGGRPEIFISSEAIMDSPLIGHGSWARSMYYYLEYRQLARLGFDISQTAADNVQDLEDVRGAEPEIPSHSVLMGSMVWAGVFGGVFWIYVLYLTVRCLGAVVLIRNTFTPAIISVCTLFLWDILFSPYGNDRRFEAAIFITVTIVATERLMKAASASALMFNHPGGFALRGYTALRGGGQQPVFDKTVWLRNRIEHRLRNEMRGAASSQEHS